MTDELKECRREFEAHPKFKHLEFTRTEDAWGRGKYLHSHVQALFDGFQVGQQSRTKPECVDIEVGARAIAIFSYHDNGLETMNYAGEKDFADREWRHYESDAKACATAWHLTAKE